MIESIYTLFMRRHKKPLAIAGKGLRVLTCGIRSVTFELREQRMERSIAQTGKVIHPYYLPPLLVIRRCSARSRVPR